jgi:beta-mannosidase
MKRTDLAGTWRLSEPGRALIQAEAGIPGKLPGCTYLDLMEAGIIPDPFWKDNEKAARETAERDFEYSRTFVLNEDDLAHEHIDLVITGLDTLARIKINGAEAGRGNNIFRTWRFPAKDALGAGENSISIYFENPLPYMLRKQKEYPQVSGGGAKGITHIRKVQSHFGWDWGPRLPPAGIAGNIALEAYTRRIEDFRVRQEHHDGAVTLSLEASAAPPGAAEDGAETELRCTLTAPDGHTVSGGAAFSGGKAAASFLVENPELWWCNGLGAQPLYRLAVEMIDGKTGAVLDRSEKKIGLRTIRLDTSPDRFGASFRFVINGVPLFAKGADWIPQDIFITRQKSGDTRFYVESAARANMNMLRVWGGGCYESEAFYDACDENGILVWQDFCFACGSYPFDDAEFLENTRQEVIDNVRRLRHRASLALWCGNNENEILSVLWKHKKKLHEANSSFYYDVLSRWVAELDGVTPYWPGSPSSGRKGANANAFDSGDTHLWQVWHGLMPVEHFRKMPARFCSEFGLESFPSIRALRAFTDDENPGINDPVMKIHQKSAGGNQKILFYLLAKYREPRNTAGMVYLSQLVQSDAMRFAVDEWRRGMERSGGALYWQFNDCWPVASWAGIDYKKQYKALQYHARHFNKPLCLSNDYFDSRAEIWLANDLPRDFQGTLEWRFADFAGHTVNSGNLAVSVPAVAAGKLAVLDYKKILSGRKKNAVALTAVLRGADGEIADEKRWLPVPDKYAALAPPRISGDAVIEGGLAKITLSAESYARYVYVEIDGVEAPLSDNFFDIDGGGSVAITAPLPPEIAREGPEQFMRRVHLQSLADIEPEHGIAAGRIRRFAMRFAPVNFITWLLFKFV